MNLSFALVLLQILIAMALIAAAAMAPTEIVDKVETEVIEPKKEDLQTAEGHLYGYGHGHGLYGG